MSTLAVNAEPVVEPLAHVAEARDSPGDGEVGLHRDFDELPWRRRTLAVHGQIRNCLVVLTVIAIFVALYFAKAVLVPITLAVMLSFVLRPAVNWLKRLGIPNIVSATAMFVAFTALVTVGCLLLVDPATKWLSNAPSDFAKVKDDVAAFIRPLAELQLASDQVSDMTKAPGGIAPVSVRVEQPALTSQLMSTTGGLLASATITSVLLFFLLAGGDQFLEKTVESIPTWRGKWEAVLLFRELQSRISVYLGSITLINIALGAVIGIALWLMGMPNSLLWGVMAALLNYIPFLGLIAGSAIVALAAVATFDSFGYAMIAPAIYLAANGVEANIATPAVLGRAINLNPVVILLSVFLFGWIWGMVGVFLAVPLLITVKIISDANESMRPVAVYLAS